MCKILFLSTIEQDLREVQAHFHEINASLVTQREYFSDSILSNLMDTYDYLNFLLAKDIDLFDGKHNHMIVELNHRVLMGTELEIRQEYKSFINATIEKFDSQIKDVLKETNKREKKWPYKASAWLFVSGVSQPQLFIEGNHRTHSALVNYVLLKANKAPFILNCSNARAFFDPTQEVKGTFKGTLKTWLKMLSQKKKFKDFLEHYTSDRYAIKRAK